MEAVLEYAAEYQIAHQRVGFQSEFVLNKRDDGAWCLEARSTVHKLRICMSCLCFELTAYPLVEQRVTTDLSERHTYGLFCPSCANHIAKASAQWATYVRCTAN
jgi:hypothetical protein